MNLLGESLRCRALELLGETVPIPEGGYQGEYIRDMARLYMDEQNISTPDQVKALAVELVAYFVSSAPTPFSTRNQR